MKIENNLVNVVKIDNSHPAMEAAFELYDDDPPFLLGSEIWGLARNVNCNCTIYVSMDEPMYVLVEYQSGYMDMDAYRMVPSEFGKFLGYCSPD